MGVSKKNGETPERKKPTADDPMVECDFSGLSRRWGYDWNRIDGEYQTWTSIAFEPEPDDLTPDERKTLMAGRIEAHQKRDELFTLRNELMANVLVRVPDDWLVDEVSPDDVDFSNPEHLLDFIREDRTQDLILGVQFARIAESKN